MILLSISIVVALFVTIVLPITAGFWVNKKLAVPWRVISYGVLGYFLVQTAIILLINGIVLLVQNNNLTLSNQALDISLMVLSLLLAAIFGVFIRWVGINYLNDKLDNLESAYGIGIGYGGVESILRVGLPLLMNFIAMLNNWNIDLQSTTLSPEVVAQLSDLWQVTPNLYIAGSFERLVAFLMHITVTVLILQVFKQKNKLFLAAAIGLDLFVNFLFFGLALVGLPYGWVILVSIILMIGMFYLLYWMNAFDFDITRINGKQGVGVE